MKTLITEVWLPIPDKVSVRIKARIVTVKGPRGEITKNFKHMPIEMSVKKQAEKKRKGNFVHLKMHFGGAKQKCGVYTINSLIRNMISGVTRGYRYKMRLVHAHFPINIGIPKDSKSVEIKNFLGGKQIKKIDMQPGCTIKINPDIKDELILEGIDNQNLSLTCQQISQVCKIGDKDDRKFLDGIYVSDKGHISEE